MRAGGKSLQTNGGRCGKHRSASRHIVMATLKRDVSSLCAVHCSSPSGGFFEQTGHNEVQQPFCVIPSMDKMIWCVSFTVCED